MILRETTALQPRLQNGNQCLDTLPVKVHPGLIRGVEHAIARACLLIDPEPHGGSARMVRVLIVEDAALLKRALVVVVIIKDDHFEPSLCQIQIAQRRLERFTGHSAHPFQSGGNLKPESDSSRGPS
jgi:hypothetical protein